MSGASDRAAPNGGPTAPNEGFLTGIDLLRIALRFRWLIIGLAMLFGAGTVLIQAVSKRRYAVASSFIPRSSNGQSAVSGLAAQIGIVVPAAGSEQSPAFYSDLLQSETILRALAYSPIDLGGGQRGPLIDSTIATKPAGVLAERAVLSRLRRETAASVVTKTGVIRLTVTDTSLGTAFSMNARLLELINEFNMRSRRAQAAAESQFYEDRVKQAAQALRAAEDNLQAFLTANRLVGNSPALRAQEERLRRELMRQENLFGSVSDAHERARLDAVRNTPVIVVVEPPSPSTGPLSRFSLPRIVLAALTGALLGLCWGFCSTYFRALEGRRPETVHDFANELHQFGRELRHPLRTLATRRSQ